MEIIKRYFYQGVCPYQLSSMLEAPLRQLILSPERLADGPHLSPATVVLEVGPEPGFFSVEIASRIPNGWFELFDIQPEMLVKAQGKLQSAGRS
jgi:ubiquinone/menaquinone biosynthesis C-methylase UbiE